MRPVFRLLIIILLLAGLILVPSKSIRAQAPQCYTSWPSGVSDVQGTWVGTKLRADWLESYSENVAWVKLPWSGINVASISLTYEVVSPGASDRLEITVYDDTSGIGDLTLQEAPAAGTYTVTWTGNRAFPSVLWPNVFAWKGDGPTYPPPDGTYYLVSFSYCEVGAPTPTPTTAPTNTLTPTNTPTSTPTATSTSAATATPLFHVAFTPFVGTAANLFNGLLPFWAIVVGIILAIGLLVLLVKRVREAI